MTEVLGKLIAKLRGLATCGKAAQANSLDTRRSLELVVSARRCPGRFLKGSDGHVPEATVSWALQQALRAPSGFNVQPYRAVVVRDALVRKQLAHSMLGGNIGRVLHAPLTVVWLADLRAWERIPDVIDMMRRTSDMSEHNLRAFEMDARFLLGGLAEGQRAIGHEAQAASSRLTELASNLVGRSSGVRAAGDMAHAAERGLKKAAMALLSEVTQAPTLNSTPEAWAFKNTALAAQTYILAMTSAGYDCHIMEGFDTSRVLQAVSAPADRYSVPFVVSTGVAADPPPAQPSPRFAFEDMFSRDSLDFALRPEERSPSPPSKGTDGTKAK